VGGKASPIVDAEGQPVKGEGNRKKAFTVWQETVAREKAATRGLDNPLRVIFEEFLDYTERHREKDTYADYRRTLQSFKDKWPDLTVGELSVRHVEAWFDEHPGWGDTTKNDYVTIVLTAFNWAAKPTVRLIPFNPLKGMEKPRKKSRGGKARVDEATHRALMAGVPWDFRQVLMALRHTGGTRPSNICRVTAKHFKENPGVWIFDEHNTEPGTPIHKTFKKTGKALVVPLTPALVTLCKELAAKHPEGPLFRTRRGKAWTVNAIEKRFKRWLGILAKKGVELPGVYAYCYRHQMATNFLERGESDTLVAAGLGHQGGTKVLHQHYSGVNAQHKAVLDMLTRNVGLLPEEANVSGGTGGKAQAGSASGGESAAPPVPGPGAGPVPSADYRGEP
jgi:integrase